MPGYEKCRFVDLSENTAEEFTCCICIAIYCNPVTTICGHTFCYDCITEWIKNKCNYIQTCPKCRQVLGNKRRRGLTTAASNSGDTNNNNQEFFSKSMHNFINLLEKLRIKCKYAENGCEKVVYLGDLNKHMNECEFNACEKCGLQMGRNTDHNCMLLLRNKIETITDLRKSLELEKNELLSKNQLLAKYNDALKTGNLNACQEIKTLKNELKIAVEEKQCKANEIISLTTNISALEITINDLRNTIESMSKQSMRKLKKEKKKEEKRKKAEERELKRIEKNKQREDKKRKNRLETNKVITIEELNEEKMENCNNEEQEVQSISSSVVLQRNIQVLYTISRK